MSGFLWLYFGTDGRLTRSQWWAAGTVLTASALVLFGVELAVLGVTTNDLLAGLDPKQSGTVLAKGVSRDLDVIGACDGVLFFVPWVCLSVKRRHDRGQSGADYIFLAALELVLSVGRAAPYIPGLDVPASFATDLVPATFVSGLFGLYLLVVLGFRGTVRGANFYGPDPRPVSSPVTVGVASFSYAAPPLGTSRAGTTYAYSPATAPASPKAETKNPAARYWRGLYPLGPSYWLVNVGLGVLAEIALIGFFRVFDPEGTIDPVPAFLGFSAAGLILAVLTVWLRIGAFRSAQRRATERQLAGRRAFWPRLAQFLVVPPLLLDGALFYFIAIMLLTFFPMAFENDPTVPDYIVRALPDGSSLQIDGGVKYGLAEAVAAELRAHPGIRTVVLESPGGRLGASEQVAQLIGAQGLDTYVSTHCESACTRIFVAGQDRVLREGGKLGFHSGRTDLQLPPAVVAAMNETFAAHYVSAGVSADFMQRAEAVSPASIWYPTDAELLAAHVVTRIENGSAAAAAAPVAVMPAGERDAHGTDQRKPRREID
jgi:uncharacterized membrane protein YhaH (DUF805 family)